MERFVNLFFYLVIFLDDFVANSLFFYVVYVQMHELAMKLALQKSQNAELRSQFEGQSNIIFNLFNFIIWVSCVD